MDVKKARKKLKCTQAQLAEKLGLTETHIQRLEYGKCAIQKQTELAILMLLQKSNMTKNVR